MAQVNGWVDSLKKHKNFKDARAGQLKGYFKEQGISNDDKAQNHAYGILEKGERLIDKNGNPLHQHVHDALRRELGLIEEETEDRGKKAGVVEPQEPAGEEREAEAIEEETSSEEKKLAAETADAEADRKLKEADLKLKEAELEKIKRDEARQEKQDVENEARKEKEDRQKRRKELIGAAKTAAGIAKTGIGKGGSNIFIIVAFVIYCFDALFGYIGFTEIGASWGSLLQTFVGIISSSLFIGLMVLHILSLKESIKESIGEIISYGLALAAVFFTGWSGGITGWALVHLIFIVLFWYFVIGPEEDRIRRNVWLIILLIGDFYLYLILKLFFPLGQVAPIVAFPIMFFVVTGYCYKKTENKLAYLLLVFAVFICIFANWNYISEQMKIAATTAPIEGIEKISPWEALKKAGAGVKDFWSDMEKSYERQMEYATGGYYTSKVEENKDPNSKLGVYIENIQVADRQFYENEEVVLWGDLKARTLDEPINIYMSCEAGEGNITEEGTIVPEALSNKENKYKIDKFEEIGFECRFKQGQLGPGANAVRVNVEFNFETLAFLKTYFMDIERVRALRKENIDPLEQYGIKDRSSEGVSTYGPVRLGMGTIDPPIGLSLNNDGYTYLGVTIQNEWPQGRIKNITGVTIQIPSNLELEKLKEENLYCNEGFKEVGENKEGYKIYHTIKKAISTPITTGGYKSWRCSITIKGGDNVRKILGNTPVATYYYRANATYLYEIQESTSVFVKSVPGEKTRLYSCTTLCKDSDGCICEADEACNVPKGTEISKRYTCNTTREAGNILWDLEGRLGEIKKAEKELELLIAINSLCLNEKEAELNETIKKSDLSEEYKDIFSKCKDNPLRFFRSSEDMIVKRVDSTTTHFEEIKDKLTSELKKGNNKEKVFEEKNNFLSILKQVEINFNEIDKKEIKGIEMTISESSKSKIKTAITKMESYESQVEENLSK